jgi:hypothetical protein
MKMNREDPLVIVNLSLKVLSSEMDPAEIRFRVRKVFFPLS